MTFGAAGVCTLLLALTATAMTTAWAVPVTRPPRGQVDGKDCHIEHFKSMSPQELQAFRRAKNAIEEWLLQQDVRCSSRLLPRAWDLKQLQVQERPVALQAEVALTLKVLENVTHSALEDVLNRPLRTLHHIHSQLQACAPKQPTQGSRPQSHRLSRWLHRLQDAPKKETHSCLEESVTLNLFRLLLRDLKCVASRDQCV